jgi:hypothetical protein
VSHLQIASLQQQLAALQAEVGDLQRPLIEFKADFDSHNHVSDLAFAACGAQHEEGVSDWEA